LNFGANIGIELFISFISSLSCCQEKATVAQYFGQILTRLRVADIQVFQLILWLI